jgi:phosphohistidine phosphatase SixA
VCNPLATLTAERNLQPGDPPEWMRDRLVGETGDVMIVGHMPHLARLRATLVGEDADGTAPFPIHGMVALEDAEDSWVERWRIEG